MFHYNKVICSAVIVYSLLLCGSAQDIRLVDGGSRCQGRLELPVSSQPDLYGQACDLNAGGSEAQVVCRQLGCNPNGARRVDPTRYGFSAAISVYQGFGYSCNGNEESLSQCSTSGSICRADNADYAVAIECSGALSHIQNHGQLLSLLLICIILILFY